MAFSNYTELQSSILSWLRRPDLTSEVVDFIRLAEARMIRELKSRRLGASVDVTITDGVATVPSDYRATKSFRNTTAPYTKIVPKPIDEIEKLRPTASGQPCYYDRIGDEFRFWPETSGVATLRYRADFPFLSDANATNWILEEYPDLYLGAALLEGEMYGINDARFPLMRGRVDGIIQEINLESINENSEAIVVGSSASVTP